MGRYEHGTAFWDITRTGTTLTIVAGDLDQPPTTIVEELGSQALAATRFNVLVNQKARAGYKLVRAIPAAPPAEPVMPIVLDARDPDFERALRENPEDNARFLVYGDWLQKQGDPRGELIALQAAAFAGDGDERLMRMADTFEKRHRTYLRGTFEDAPGRTLGLYLGFVRSLEIVLGPLVAPLVAALELPSARFISRIVLDDDGVDELADAIAVLATRAPVTLRHLGLGGTTRVADLAALAPLLSQLRSFKLTSIANRELDVDPRCLAVLAATPLPALETLTLELVHAPCTLADLRPLLARTDLDALVELRVRTSFDASITNALVEGPLAAQLEILAFDELDDAAARAVVAHRARFGALRELHVARSRLSNAMFATLGALVTLVDLDEHNARFDSGYE